MIDLGAHVGVFTLDAASCGAQVLAVEAQSEFLPILEKHALSNGLQGNVTVEHALVAASGGLFSDEKERDEASHWRTSPPVVTFSQLCTKHQIEQIDLLKVDIEGSEFALFEELERDSKFASIKRIALEAHPRYGKPETLVGLLRSEGFRTLTAPAGVAGREHFIYATK